jgi:2-C-methyl-D-erythritol 2,4-cyclodiphosphate synthase
MNYNIRIGHGYDVHRFVTGRDLILGGVKIDHHQGLEGHSDADVLTHAIIDSLLSASSLGDIGTLFPDTDERYRGISSIMLLKEVCSLLEKSCISVINIDTTLICEKPKISPYRNKMKEILSDTINISKERIGVKGKTSEKLGFTGRGEGIEVHSVALIALDVGLT